MTEKKIKLIKDIVNNPYLPLISYRIGNYSTFRYSLIESIKRDGVLKDKWTDYSSSNYGVVIVEMWAYLLDILTYYQERIANEAYSRTAQLRESIIRQCNLIDYKLKPGVSATTYVQFTAEKDRSAIVPKSFKVQTKPISGKEPLIFETDETILVSSQLNDMQIAVPRITHNLQTCVRLLGRYDNLKPGDFIMVKKKDLTANAQYGINWAVSKLTDITHSVTQNDSGPVTNLNWDDIGSTNFDCENSQLYYLSGKMYIFGYNAPSIKILAKLYDPATNYTPGKLPGKESDEKPTTDMPKNNLRLDKVYDGLKINDSVVVIDQQKVAASSSYSDASAKLFKIDKITENMAINYGLSSKVTVLVIDPDLPEEITSSDGFDIRSTLVLGNPVELPAIKTDIDPDHRKLKVEGKDNGGGDGNSGDKQRNIVLDGVYSDLKEGMYISIIDIGQTNDTSEVHRITNVTASKDGLSTTITVAEPFKHEFDKVTTKINTNVAPVSHGETIKDEILGSGNAAQQYQEFTLKEKPVTFTPSAVTNTGGKNSLEIFVNNIKWGEMEEGSLDSTPTDTQYITSIDSEDNMHVTFGNGTHGSLLPTGIDNIHAKYRKGIGAAGNFAFPNTITVLMGTNPAVKSVTNLRGASGGADRENEDDAKMTAPRSLKALNRAVSIEDYENLALSYSGVTKAKAYLAQFQQVQANETGLIRIIIAPKSSSEKGVEHATDILRRNLRNYLDLRRDSNISLKIEDFNSVSINVKAKIQVKDQYLKLAVKKAVETAMGSTINEDGTYNFFAFDRLKFGQTIHLSDIYAAIARIEGVEYVIVKQFNKPSEVDLKPIAQYVQIKENEIAELGELTILPDGGID